MIFHGIILYCSKEKTIFRRALLHSLNYTIFSDHIEYVRDFIGVDYVGIAGDFDGVTVYVVRNMYACM